MAIPKRNRGKSCFPPKCSIKLLILQADLESSNTCTQLNSSKKVGALYHESVSASGCVWSSKHPSQNYQPGQISKHIPVVTSVASFWEHLQYSKLEVQVIVNLELPEDQSSTDIWKCMKMTTTNFYQG